MTSNGLSCYTAALHAYLAAEWDAPSVVARSVRLAVRPDDDGGPLAFSHHEPSLDGLPDGSRLAYAAAPSSPDALPEVAAELARHGRAIVVVDSSRLPWSVTRGDPPAPHWLLVDGAGADGWHVRDDFSALLPSGEQRPYQGWIDHDALVDVMTLPPQWRPVQQLRNELAFGAPVAVPPGCALWLRRGPDDGGAPTPAADDGWLAGDEEVVPFLIGYAAEASGALTAHLDDLWAAAEHRSFALRWQLEHFDTNGDRAGVESALERWEALPRLLRVAVESAARGRPRPSLVASALQRLDGAVRG